MWLLFTVLIATASGQSKNVTYTTHIDGGMEGFNPFCMNCFIHPDPGRRSMLFQPLQNPIYSTDDEVLLNPFLTEAEEVKCYPDLIAATVTSYIEFQNYAASSAYRVSSDVNHVSALARFDISTPCETKSNSRDDAMRHFFEGTGGEVVFVKAECVTHTITIEPFEPLSFAPAFEKALGRLYHAALDPASEASDTTFSDFVKCYGTHFSKRTQIGAKTILGKMFSSRAATVEEEAARRRCVREAAQEALTPCMRRCNETTLTHFARASSEKCGETEQEVLASITGLLPEGTMENWASVAEELPDPIFYHLEPISTLFRQQWSSSFAETINIDKTILSTFFQEKISTYNSRMMTGGFEHGRSSGPVLIMGGWGSAGDLSSGEAINTWTLPDLPVAVVGSTLAAVGSKIYSLGGWPSSGELTASCHVIDRAADSPQWASTTCIPTAMYHHSSVAIKDHIWTVNYGKLYDLNTETNKFHTFHLPLTVMLTHCAVSNGSHSFIIGAGSSLNEIWVNTDEYNPARWHRVGYLRAARRYFGCVWVGREVFITGGASVRADTEVFNTLTHGLGSAGRLVQGRLYHGMMVLDGRPAVVGGIDSSTHFSSIETYDVSTGKWVTSARSLIEGRSSFGLVQLHW